jgi:hypothetical protein
VSADPFTKQERPTVRIALLGSVPEEMLRPILWGLEEEGIPAETREAVDGSTRLVAKQAADGSPLNVGIGINGAHGEVVLHHRDLHGDSPLFSFSSEEMNPSVLRILGVNAARLVKGNPLLFQDTSPNEGSDDPSDQAAQSELETLIAKVLMETLEKR